ncbi:papilin-like isoform X2 [Dermacentor silvarum]|uniref:papilin-like isoform X2 n=1 Tax=Dermacentor silvarum TaxID=543639 RepID=UPI001897FF88|nr:papilin-like isoform X2 [Dermacentor silvarum]
MGGATHLRWLLLLCLCWKSLTLSPEVGQAPHSTQSKAADLRRRNSIGADGSPPSSASAAAAAEATAGVPLSRSWTSWSPWSPCSRSCGGGLSYQTRRCLGRPPRHRRVRNSKKAGRCRGPAKRYRICGVEPCNANETDPRQEQCSAFDNMSFGGNKYVWKKFLREPADCQLHCQPMGHRFYATLAKLVRDGTPCSTGLDDRVCIGGSCLAVGCDGVVSSRRSADLCGVCGGDNATCRTFSGLLTLRNLSKDYEVIAVIPKGAASLVATSEGNRLAVKDAENGRFILNGNAGVWDPAGVYAGAGTRFHYRVQNRTGTQSLEARGPLARPVHLMLVFRSPNLGVKFQYSVSSRVANKGVPPSAPADEPSLGGQFLRSRAVLETGPFRWQLTFTCSKTCGTGLLHTVASCVLSATGAPVPEEHCSNLPRLRTPPSPSQPVPCNTQPCPTDRSRSGAGGDMDGSPRWQVTSDWSACSATCGDGLQRRTVVCVGLRGGALRDSACNQEKPPSVKPCNSKPCAVWQAGPWGKCSSECGKGMRKREVSCGPGLKVSACKASEKPVTEQVCEMPPCSSTWFFSAWSECSVKCVPGVQRRRVFCVPGQNECDMLDKPSSQQPCLELCTGTWFVGPWSKCLPGCGNGTRERQVLCVGQQGGRWTTVLPDGHCGYTERPLASEPCETPCAPEWHTSAWSTCSTSCGGRGSQTRQSLCLDVNGEVAGIEACSESSRPSARRPCGLSACPAETAEERGCRDTRNRCALVVQARLCSYPYFRQGCCASCRRAASSHPPPDEDSA